jgi:UDP-N-acetyl-D-glucosamine dehydrogenase
MIGTHHTAAPDRIRRAVQADLRAKIQTGQAHVAVIGRGGAGRARATALAGAGFRVTFVDRDERMEAVSHGHCSIPDVGGLHFARQVQAGRLQATAEPAVLREADVAIIAAPPPHSRAGQPDLTFIQQAVAMLVDRLRPGMLVILESATYPGTTQEVLLPLLEARGLVCGRDFELAYSPERVDPGNARFGLRNTPRTVSGVTPEARSLAAALYEQVGETVVPVTCPRVAEMARLIESMVSYVNTALTHEIARLCETMGINAGAALDAAATRVAGPTLFEPGPGGGGDAVALASAYFDDRRQKRCRPPRLVEQAESIHDQMPETVVERVTGALQVRGKPLSRGRILVVGVSSRRDSGDLRESLALKVIERLHRKGAEVSYHDPHVPVCANGKGPMTSVPLDEATLRRADCVVILTDHSGLPYDRILRAARAVVDPYSVLRNRSRRGDPGP